MRPRITWVSTMIHSPLDRTTTAVPDHQPIRRSLGREAGSIEITQASVIVYSVNDTANLNGFSQTGAPTSTLGSTASPTAQTAINAIMAIANTINGRCQRRTLRMAAPFPSSRVVLTLPGWGLPPHGRYD